MRRKVVEFETFLSILGEERGRGEGVGGEGGGKVEGIVTSLNENSYLTQFCDSLLEIAHPNSKLLLETGKKEKTKNIDENANDEFDADCVIFDVLMERIVSLALDEGVSQSVSYRRIFALIVIQ